MEVRPNRDKIFRLQRPFKEYEESQTSKGHNQQLPVINELIHSWSWKLHRLSKDFNYFIVSHRDARMRTHTLTHSFILMTTDLL